MIKRNISLRIASVMLAVALWVFVMSGGQTEVSMEAPVEFINLPAGLEVVEPDSIPQIAVGVRGHERFLERLAPDDVRIRLDMKNAKEGRHTYSIKSGNVKLPSPLRILNIHPATVKVRIRRTP